MVSSLQSGIVRLRIDAMNNQPISTQGLPQEATVAEKFLDLPNEESFADLFKVYNPQLVAFFRSRGCDSAAEDLAQEVMFTVYRKADQVRDRALFRAWVFKVARNSLCRHYGKRSREVETVDLEDVPERLVTAGNPSAGTPAFEFHHWMGFLDSREREALTLRFIEQWEYHEIAAAQAIPIGTVQWRVFSAKKKLAPHLKRAEMTTLRRAA
jgi:RNA polymerase sigma-70 factor (ECF subfamily)